MDVVIGSDEPIARLGIRSLLEDAEGVRIVADIDLIGACAYSLVHPVDALVLDASFSLETAQSVARIVTKARETAVLFLGHGSAATWLATRLNLGRVRILDTRTVSAESLAAAIRSLVEQVTTSSSRYDDHSLAESADQPPNGAGAQKDGLASALSAREWEVLSLITRGFSDKQIAHHLVLSQHTVKSHVRSLLRKLRTRNRTAAAAAYMSLVSTAPPLPWIELSQSTRSP